MVQILVEQVLLGFLKEMDHQTDLVPQLLVILDIILMIISLKVTLMRAGVRLLVVVVERLKLIPQFLLQVQQAQVVLQKQVLDQHQLLHR